MITPMDIHNKTFSRGLRGYSQEEVDAFLQELASDYERIYREHREMEEEMDTVKTSTLVMAQETAENVKRNAQKEAELAVREAQNEAHHIISDAEAARRKLNTDLLKTEGDVKIYIEKILANFKSAMALIESAKNTPEPQIVKAPEGQDEEMELPIEALDDRSADLFEGEVKADTAEAETDEAEDETQQAVSEI